MPALAQIDLGTLTPEQRDAAVQAIAALETLRAENETLVDCNETLAEGCTSGLCGMNEVFGLRAVSRTYLTVFIAVSVEVPGDTAS